MKDTARMKQINFIFTSSEKWFKRLDLQIDDMYHFTMKYVQCTYVFFIQKTLENDNEQSRQTKNCVTPCTTLFFPKFKIEGFVLTFFKFD